MHAPKVMQVHCNVVLSSVLLLWPAVCCSAVCISSLHIHDYESRQAIAILLQAGRYAWVETWSEEHNRPFYYDQVAKVSTWDKPADLAWRRVYINPEAVEESPSNLDPK